MKTIIAGSRSVTKLHVVRDAVLYSGFRISEVVSGGARGVDKLGERWAKMNQVPFLRFSPGWRDKDGCLDRRAGMLRNEKMAAYAEALVAVWDGESPGTRDMIERAHRHGLLVSVVVVGEDGELSL